MSRQSNRLKGRLKITEDFSKRLQRLMRQSVPVYRNRIIAIKLISSKGTVECLMCILDAAQSSKLTFRVIEETIESAY